MDHLLLKALALLLLVAACETTTGRRIATDPALPPQERGRLIYEGSCNRCHALFMPSSYRTEEWAFFVQKYGKKARLSADERDLVMAYLHANGRR